MRTSAGAAAQLLGQGPPAGDADAWLFVERGDFLQARRNGEPAASAGHAPWVLAIDGRGMSYGIGGDALDIASLGDPAVIPPGRIPAVDARRAPVGAAGGGAAAAR